MSEVYDFLVVGAGIAGSSIGASLAASARVAVLDMEDRPGYHSTGRSAASWIEQYGNDTVIKLNRASFDFLNAPPDDFPCEGVLLKRGSIWTARHGCREAFESMLCSHIVEIDAATALQHVPALAPERLVGLAWEPEVYDIDIGRLHEAHLKLLRQRGGELFCDAEVVSIDWTDGQWKACSRDGRVFRAAVVINAAGAWADLIAELAGVAPVGLVPKRRSAAMVVVPEEYDVADWPFVIDIHEAFYFRPEGGKLMLSPSDETPVEAHDAWADDLAIAEAAEVFKNAMQFEVDRVTHTWGGLRTFAPDDVPVVGMDAEKRFFWLAGQGGYGIQTSPAMAGVATALLLEQALPEEVIAEDLDPAELSPSRFRV